VDAASFKKIPALPETFWDLQHPKPHIARRCQFPPRWNEFTQIIRVADDNDRGLVFLERFESRLLLPVKHAGLGPASRE